MVQNPPKPFELLKLFYDFCNTHKNTRANICDCHLSFFQVVGDLRYLPVVTKLVLGDAVIRDVCMVFEL